MADIANSEAPESERVHATMKGILLSFNDYVRHGRNIVRSSVIGIVMGALPGVGATIASIVAYTTAKNLSKTPEEFGKGSEEAIIATESANNATSGGTLIPLLTLGIPGGLADSILLGALVLHNLQPGPLLYVNNPEIVNSIMATHLFAHIVMFALMTGGILFFARLMLLPIAYIFPTVLVFCVIGAYSLSNNMFDVGVMLVFGVIGIGLEIARVPLAPLVVGYVLAPLGEGRLRSGLMAADGDFSAILDRPITLTILALAAIILILPFMRNRKLP
jgi:putative tricarboxylic transport membrane protein